MKKKLVLLILSVVLGITVIFLIVLLGSKTVTVQNVIKKDEEPFRFSIKYSYQPVRSQLFHKTNLDFVI